MLIALRFTSGSIPILPIAHRLEVWGYTDEVRLRGLNLACGGRLCLCSRDFQEAVGEFVGGVTPQHQGEAFAFIFCGYKPTLSSKCFAPTYQFWGSGSDPSLIRQQHLSNRQVFLLLTFDF